MNNARLRMARESDAAAIAAIYAPYVEHTAVSFETDPPDAAEFQKRIRKTLQGHPYLVYENAGAVVGYAYACKQMERAAYRWNAELSVYLDRNAAGRGIGTALYAALMDILRLQRIRNVYGGITRPNPASENLHKRLGFTKLGVYRNTGFKLGQWHDVVWYEKRIGDAAVPPLPPLPVSEVPAAAVAAILAQAGGRTSTP